MIAATCLGTMLLTVPDLPTNRWVLLHDQAPNIMWENGIAWDPRAGKVVWHGGHIGRIYPQSNYTFLYDPVRDRFTESQAPLRPQRRCLVHVAYLEGPRRTVTTDGGVSHGSIPSGGLSGEYKAVFRSDARGPWLYDSAEDVWEDCRTLPPVWKRKAHAPIAYEPQSDALFGLRETELNIFLPRLNRVFTRPLPEELHHLLGYGLAADPIRRKLVVFGGTVTIRRPEPVNGKNVYDTAVKDFTWVYDIAADAWKRCAPTIRPPKGVPKMDMLSLQMVWHDASGTVLLMQNATEEPGDNRHWPPAELWNFDVASEQWTRVPMDAAGERPAFMGLLAYARERDQLFLFGGGRDGVGNPDIPGIRPALSRQVWGCRVRVPGRTHAAPAANVEISATCADDGVRLEWAPLADRRHELQRAPCAPLVGAYERLAPAPVSGGVYLDRTAAPGKVYAYRLVAEGGTPCSLPAFNQPRRPAGLVVSVESARETRLRWKPNHEPDVTGYRVYRAKGADVEKGEGRLLTPEPVRAPRFVDTTVDLSDGVICSYWVTAVNRAGIESGAAPLAWTAPDAPEGLSVPEGVGPSDDDGRRLNYVVNWQWPPDLRVAGFNVYGASDVPNGSSPEMLRNNWKKLTATPFAGREFVYEDPKDAPVCRFFYIRAVNVLGQEGFCTDIVSPTDRRFRP